MEHNFLLMLFLSNLIFISSSEIECDGTIIEHCSKCSTSDDSDACAICDDYYFPFFSDLFCLPCNDSIYGQTACEGKCNITNYITTRFVQIVVKVLQIVRNVLMKSVGQKQMGNLFVMNVKVMNICYQNLENARNVI